MKQVLDLIEIKKLTARETVVTHACDYNAKTDKVDLQIGQSHKETLKIQKMKKLSRAMVEAKFTSARVSKTAEAKIIMTVTAYKKGVKMKSLNITAKPCFCRENIGSHKVTHTFAKGMMGDCKLVDMDTLTVEVKLISKNFQECVCLMKSSIKLTLVEG